MRKRQKKKNLYKLWLGGSIKRSRRISNSRLYDIGAWCEYITFINRHELSDSLTVTE